MSLNGAAMFIAMVIIIILFEIILTITKGSAGMSFITPTNLFSILRQQAYTGIIAFGLTLVMITGNIDLSVGSMLTFLCCVCAKIMMGSDNGLLGIFGTIAAGAICGLINGVLVSYVKLNSFITTLGTSSIFTALALRISSGTVLVIPDNCDPLFQAIGITSFGPVHILIVWFVIVAVVLGLLLSRTVYGQQLYTIGSNPVAARHPCQAQHHRQLYHHRSLCGSGRRADDGQCQELQPPGLQWQGDGNHPGCGAGRRIRHRRQGLRLGQHHRCSVLRRSVRRLHPAEPLHLCPVGHHGCDHDHGTVH